MVRYWTCQRVAGGLKCQAVNPAGVTYCHRCLKAKPKRKKPAHMKALDLTYEEYVFINGGEFCGICNAVAKPGGRRLHRDHDHRTGKPRGLLCFRCNAALRLYMTAGWLRSAIRYLERTA